MFCDEELLLKPEDLPLFESDVLPSFLEPVDLALVEDDLVSEDDILLLLLPLFEEEVEPEGELELLPDLPDELPVDPVLPVLPVVPVLP
jgi:hypothetical protein